MKDKINITIKFKECYRQGIEKRKQPGPSGLLGSIPSGAVYMKKQEMIRQLKEQKFSEKIIQAFEEVPRENFVPEEIKEKSYEDTALPIGFKQTISQPYTIAFMLTLLNVKDKQKILEIGSGSGYVLALLSQLTPNGKIFGIERIKELTEVSRKALSKYKNIEIIFGDGSKGLKKQMPFDRILVSASAKEMPQHLAEQLKFGGVLVCPVKNSIIVLEKTSGENKIREYHGFSFVPLIEE